MLKTSGMAMTCSCEDALLVFKSLELTVVEKLVQNKQSLLLLSKPFVNVFLQLKGCPLGIVRHPCTVMGF